MSDRRKFAQLLGGAVAVVLVGTLAVALFAGATPSGSVDPRISSSTIPPDAFAAAVTYVHDGDTLFIDTGSAERKVRLIGIDTPELDSTQHPDAGQCYGEEARGLLRDFLPEGTEVWALEDREPEDRYGRSLLYLYLEDGTFVNLAMVELGAAEAIKVGSNDLYWPELLSAEEDAIAAQLGLWSRC